MFCRVKLDVAVRVLFPLFRVFGSADLYLIVQGFQSFGGLPRVSRVWGVVGFERIVYLGPRVKGHLGIDEL